MTDNIVNLPKGEPAGDARWADSFVNLLAGLGVEGRDKFAHQQYTFSLMSVLELENAYRGDWLARKAVTIPAWDMTREWRSWQADPDQIKLLEAAERKLFMQQKVQDALLKSRLYGGAVIVIGVDAGRPEDELDLETVKQDSLKFLHVVSRNQISTGPIVYDITSKYYGHPEYYEARNQPASKDFQQADKPPRAYGGNSVRLHPSRVVKLIGVDTADQLLTNVWGDSVLQAVNDSIKAAGLVNGSLATLCSELKIDVIKIPELKSILSTADGTRKMLARFSAANVAKSTVNTILIDGNEEWQRIQATLAGVPEIIATYLQTVAGAVDIPAGRFLGLPHRGLNVTGEADFRNYYDHLASEQSVTLQPAMSVLDEVLIRSALGDRPETIFYEWDSLWQLSDGDKADIALKKAQTYQIDVNAAQLPPTALANGRANQLIEDGFYPGLEQALDDAAAEGDTIEEQNAPQPMPMMGGVDPMTGEPMDPNAPPGNGSVLPFPPKKPAPKQTGQLPFGRKSTLPGGKGAGDSADRPFDGEDELGDDDYEPCHEPAGSSTGGQFVGCGEGGAGGEKLPGEFEHPGKGYSKEAYVDDKGVIQTTKVEDAQRALYENRRVNLDQPSKVSTLVKRLGDDTRAAIAKGQRAPNVNMCNVSVSGTNLFCSETKGIPRIKMPQLDEERTKAFVRDLKSKGYEVTKEEWPASHMKATQSELSGVKVWQQVEKAKLNPERLLERVVISRDGYILDKHHHWAAKIALDSMDNKLTGKMRVYRVNANITTLLERAGPFSGPAKPAEQEVKVTFKRKKRDGAPDAPDGLFGGLFGGLFDELWGDDGQLSFDEYEACHLPAGSPEGGQFTGCEGAGAAAVPPKPLSAKAKKDLVKELFAKGTTAKEIAEKTGWKGNFSITTVGKASGLEIEKKGGLWYAKGPVEPEVVKTGAPAPSVVKSSELAAAEAQVKAGMAKTSSAASAELEAAKKSTAIMSHTIPGGSNPGAAPLIQEFNAKYAGKTLTDPGELAHKIAAYKGMKEKIAALPEPKGPINTGASEWLKKGEDLTKTSPRLQKSGMTGQEAAHIIGYTDGEYGKLNKGLRAGALTPEQHNYVKHLDAALDRLPPHEGETRRGAELSPEARAHYKVGMVVHEAGYASTSKHRKFGGNTTFHFKGHSGRDVSFMSLHPNEGEVLYKRGTWFKVVKITGNTIHLEEQ